MIGNANMSRTAAECCHDALGLHNIPISRPPFRCTALNHFRSISPKVSWEIWVYLIHPLKFCASLLSIHARGGLRDLLDGLVDVLLRGLGDLAPELHLEHWGAKVRTHTHAAI